MRLFLGSFLNIFIIIIAFSFKNLFVADVPEEARPGYKDDLNYH